MARPLRIEYPNAVYHVMNRGLSRQDIYRTNDDYKVFLETLKESSKLFNTRIISYCLMPNHYHLLIQTPKANLSRAMRHLNGVYTQRFNRIHKKDGPLFRGRYKAILIQEDEYLKHLIRYIHLNPVQANLTQDPAKFPWSSHSKYLKTKDEKPWLFVKLALSFFGTKTHRALTAYQTFIDQGIDSKTLSFYNKKNQDPILGDPDFVNHIKEKYLYGRENLSSEIPDRRKLSGAAVVDRIMKEVSISYKTSPKTLLLSKRGESHPSRHMAIYLSRELSGLTLPEISAHFKGNSYKTINSGCQRFKARLTKDSQTKQRYGKILNRCMQGEI